MSPSKSRAESSSGGSWKKGGRDEDEEDCSVVHWWQDEEAFSLPSAYAQHKKGFAGHFTAD